MSVVAGAGVDPLLSEQLRDAASTLISLSSVSESLPAVATSPVASTSTLEPLTGRPRSHSLRRRSLEEFRVPEELLAARRPGKEREGLGELPQLLRRCSSVENLEEGDSGNGLDDDFSSEVGSLLRLAVLSSSVRVLG